MSASPIEKVKSDIQSAVESKEGYVFFNVPTLIYSMNIVLKTCFAFLDQVYVFLDGDPKTAVKVRIKFKKESSQQDLQNFIGEFYNEMLNQVLREHLSEEQKSIRQYIVSQALYGAKTATPPKDVLMKKLEEQMDVSEKKG